MSAQYAECKSCGARTAMEGVRKHGKTCQTCGKVLFQEFADGSAVVFIFLGPGNYWSVPKLSMLFRRWDTVDGGLYLARDTVLWDRTIADPETAEAYLLQHAGRWQAVEEAGEQLVRVPFGHDGTPVIEIFQRTSYVNYKLVTDMDDE